mgnify:CR=1 FL=1
MTKAEFSETGFTDAHLGGTRFVGYRTMGTLTAEVVRLVRGGEPFVYAYYEGLDKVSHEYGLGEQYDPQTPEHEAGLVQHGREREARCAQLRLHLARRFPQS